MIALQFMKAISPSGDHLVEKSTHKHMLIERVMNKMDDMSIELIIHSITARSTYFVKVRHR